MEHKECKFGTLVCTKNMYDEIEQVGMVIGITNNCPLADFDTRKEASRAIPEVKFSSGEVRGVHPSHLFLL